MIGVTIFGLFLTPVFYVLLRSRYKPRQHEGEDDEVLAHAAE